jgi:hypothetical protein
MKAIFGLLAVASSAATLLATGSPASAQSYFPQYNSQPSRSFTGYSGTRYKVYTPKSNSSGSSFGGSFDQPSSSNKGWGHSSGSYFGW